MDRSADGGDEGVDSRQLLFVGICLVGLVTAAFLAPVTGENDALGVDGGVPDGLVADLAEFLFGEGEERSADEGDEPPPPEGGGDGGGGIPGWLVDIFEWLPGVGGGEATGEPSRCQVYVGSDPTPGQPTTVVVTVDGEPVPDARVWFNDQFAGRTDDRGTVTAETPYVSELDVTVESPIDEPCAFSRQPSIGQRPSGPAATPGVLPDTGD